MNENYVKRFLRYLKEEKNYSKNTVISYANDLIEFIKIYKNKSVFSK